jgi:hypothetical protein
VGQIFIDGGEFWRDQFPGKRAVPAQRLLPDPLGNERREPHAACGCREEYARTDYGRRCAYEQRFKIAKIWSVNLA